jgi:hypothetical protein
MGYDYWVYMNLNSLMGEVQRFTNNRSTILNPIFGTTHAGGYPVIKKTALTSAVVWELLS